MGVTTGRGLSTTGLAGVSSLQRTATPTSLSQGIQGFLPTSIPVAVPQPPSPSR